MPKVRTTLTIDGNLLRAVKIAAARSGQADSEVIEAAVRRDLGFEVIDRLWARNDMSEDAAMDLALDAQRAARAPARTQHPKRAAG